MTYLVRDVYGSAVVPENIGNVEPEPFNNHPSRLPSDILASVGHKPAIRDGASSFYHPYRGTGYPTAIVEGIRGTGYTCASAGTVRTG
jgi:hypothetical protein